MNILKSGLNFTSLVLQMSAKVCPHAFPGSAFQGMTPEDTTEYNSFIRDIIFLSTQYVIFFFLKSDRPHITFFSQIR